MLALTKVLFEISPNATAMMLNSPEGRKAAADIAAEKAADPGRFVPANVAGPTNVDAAALGAKAAMKTINTESPAKHELMRRTFNALPNKGRDLHIAGKDQSGIINAADQKQFDTMYKNIASEQTPGVPGKVVQKAVKAVSPAQTDITAGQAAGILAKKGAHAVGDAAVATGNTIASGAKGLAQHLTEHPLAAAGTLAVGAAGALGLRRLVNRNRPA